MKNNLIMALLILLFASVSVIGCSKKSPYAGNETIIRELSSPEYRGRLAGTAGNQKAQKYIEQHYRSIGLYPYRSEQFAQPYTQVVYDPDKQIHHTELHLKDGSTKRLVYGTDYIEQSHTAGLDCTAKLTMRTDDPDMTRKIVLLRDRKLLPAMLLQKPMAILLETETLKKYLPHSQLADVPILQLSQASFTFLEEHFEEIDFLRLRLTVEGEQAQVSNVVGMIQGAGTEDAVVISAHYDSVGWNGELVFGGSLDNASGIAALIQLAYNFKQHSITRPLHADLIFAAFNGEESGLQGSRAFVQSLQGHYKSVYNINLDCVAAARSGDPVIIGDRKSRMLMETLASFFEQNDIRVRMLENGYSSDHLSFSDKNMPAVTMGSDPVPRIHSLLDTPDEIDHSMLNKIINGIFNAVLVDDGIHEAGLSRLTSTSDELPPVMTPGIQELVQQELARMKLGEYKLAGNQFLVQRSVTSSQPEEIESKISGLHIPRSLNSFILDTVRVDTDILNSATELPKLETDRIYTYSPIPVRNVTRIQLLYKNEIGEGVSLTISHTDVQVEAMGTTQEFPTETTEYNGNLYQLVNTNQNLILKTERKVGDKTYHIQAYKGKDAFVSSNQAEGKQFTLAWTPNDRDLALAEADGLELEELIRKLGLP